METQPNDSVELPLSDETLAADPNLIGLILLAMLLSFIAGRLTTRCGRGQAPPAPVPRPEERRVPQVRRADLRPAQAQVTQPPNPADVLSAVLAASMPRPSAPRPSTPRPQQINAQPRNDSRPERMNRTARAGGQLPAGINQYGEID